MTAEFQAMIGVATRWRFELGVVTVIAAIMAAGFLGGAQHELDDAQLHLTSRQASGELVIVEIDAKSLAALDTWPWPRGTHAELIAKLVAVDAKLIAMDVDFSSPSTPGEDAKLAQAIAASGGRVVLPSFMQHTHSGRDATLIERRPLAVVAEQALVGNANVFAPDGKARNSSLGLFLPNGEFRPTFAALIGQRGQSNVNDFGVDFSIDPSTIPRFSYADVLSGSFDVKGIQGKRVIVGATAIELGDRVPVPKYGIIAGVEFQALVAESILQGRMLTSFGMAGAMLLVVLLVAVMRPGTTSWSFRSFGLRPSICTAALVTIPLFANNFAVGVVETAPAIAALILCLVIDVGREFASRAQNVMRERSTNVLRRAMTNLIVDESSDGVVVADGRGRIELANDRAGRLLNSTQPMLMGRMVTKILPLYDDMQMVEDCEHQQRRCELTTQTEGGIRHLDIHLRRFDLRLAATGADQVARFDVYTLRDVTEKRKGEDAERQANEVRLMAERAKSNFIANMSHELRTPLNAIIGFSEMMAAQTLGPMGVPAYVEYSDVVAQSGRHLLGLVNNVLELSRIDRDEEVLETDEFDFVACATVCADLTKATRDYKGQSIDIQPTQGSSLVCAVSRLTKHALINLLSNAVKFSGKESTVTLRSWTEQDAFVLEIEDQGTGVDPAILPHLTILFHHSESGFTRKHDGMGIGLCLVKRSIERMNGAVAFDSALGRGTRVRVTLPGAAQTCRTNEVAA